MVIDENNVKVGKTYNRRARQLVGKQRAVWADDTHTAILLSPAVDAHEWQVAEAVGGPGESSGSGDEISWDERRLYTLAAKRVRERKRFIWHSVALLPGYLLLALICVGALDFVYYGDIGYVFYVFCFLLGSWTTAYAIHAYSFIKPRLKIYSRRSEAERIRAEMDRLKVMEPKKIRLELERTEL
jgi:hypothetical protein